ncbi:MAG: UvrB/UvrC motif-containing protein [Armatimonadota bacterium]
MELPVCEVCGRKPATVYVKLIAGAHQQDMRLCAECAAKQQALALPFSIEVGEDGQIGVSFRAPSRGRSRPAGPLERCRTCGTTSREFRRTGRLGCAECYGGLARTIRAAMESGDEEDEGEEALAPPQSRLMRLQLELAEAVAKEDYERAARLRDEIKALQS